jgi:DNA-directed RNA polymerase subunit omega
VQLLRNLRVSKVPLLCTLYFCFLCCVRGRIHYADWLDFWSNILNSELCRKALEKVGNPNVLVNLVSRRVRQLNSGGGSLSRPLIADVANLGAADIALLEIIEEKMGWDMPEIAEVEKPASSRKRKRH